MKIRIDIDEEIMDTEIIIRCKEIDEEIINLQKRIMDSAKTFDQLVCERDDVEYYLPLKSILFFETNDRKVRAHTRTEIFYVKYKLYQLQDLLPGNFVRISKSSIVNVNQIYSISKSIATDNCIEFIGCDKRTYISRNYYKALRDEIENRRYNYER